MAASTIRAPLWVQPTGAARRRLEDAIAWAAAETGGPRFPPHLTLASSIELPREEAERRLKQLAARLEPFEIVLERIAWLDERHRSLFAAARRTPEVEAAHALAREVFELPDKPFMPHLSLLYGDYPEALKRRLAARLETLAGLAFTVESVHLARAGKDQPESDWGSLAERTLRPMAGVE